jgi:hypothetical protein
VFIVPGHCIIFIIIIVVVVVVIVIVIVVIVAANSVLKLLPPILDKATLPSSILCRRLSPCHGRSMLSTPNSACRLTAR